MNDQPGTPSKLPNTPGSSASGVTTPVSGVATQSTPTQTSPPNPTPVSQGVQQMGPSSSQPATPTPMQPQPAHPIAPPGAVVRTSMPQVQVIHQQVPGQQQYIQQQYQIMLQNVQAAMQGLAAQQVNLGSVQNRGAAVVQGTKSPNILPVSTMGMNFRPNTSQSATAVATQTPKCQLVTAKTGTAVPQQRGTAPVFGQKQVIQPQAQPLVIGQLGVISNQGVGGQSMINQPKSPAASQAQVLNSLNNPTQIRFSNQPTFVTNAGHILNGNQVISQLINNSAMATLQHIGPDNMLGSQSANILHTQPLYIRTTGPMQMQQGLVGNVQQVAPAKSGHSNVQMKNQAAQVKVGSCHTVKGVQQILPQGARPGQGVQKQVQQVQVQPTNLSVPQIQARSVGPQQKQVSKVRALKPQTKSSSPNTTVRSAPQSTSTQTRTIAPSSTHQPPTVMVHPSKVQHPPPRTEEIRATVAPTINESRTTVSTARGQPSRAMNTDTVAQVNGALTATSPSSSSVTDGSKLEEPMEVDGGQDGGNAETTLVGVEKRPALVNGRENGDKVDDKPRLVVRPHVLTHVIEGFVIQEAREPFPVHRSSMFNDYMSYKPATDDSNDDDKDKTDKDDDESDSDDSDSDIDKPGGNDNQADKERRARFRQTENGTDDEGVPRLKCEFCGKLDFAIKFKRSNRFCSRACAKRYNVGCSRRVGIFRAGSDRVGRYIRKKKSLSVRRGWKRGQAGRVSSGPIQRGFQMAAVTESLRISTSSMATSCSSPEKSSESEATRSPRQDIQPASSPKPSPPKAAAAQHHSSSPRANLPAAPPPVESSDTERSTTPSAMREESSSPSSPTEIERMNEMEVDSAENESAVIHPRRHPREWTVQEVYDFIRTLPGCTTYADEFKGQEIDGQALLLLKEDHLMSAMNIKLGPALKIFARINCLKDELS